MASAENGIPSTDPRDDVQDDPAPLEASAEAEEATIWDETPAEEPTIWDENPVEETPRHEPVAASPSPITSPTTSPDAGYMWPQAQPQSSPKIQPQPGSQHTTLEIDEPYPDTLEQALLASYQQTPTSEMVHRPTYPVQDHFSSSTAPTSPMTPYPVQYSPEPPTRHFLAAWLFSVLGGGLGLDRFYLGKYGTGILKLLTFGGFGMWAFVDVMLLLFTTVRDAEGRPLQDQDKFRVMAIVLTALPIVLGMGLLFFIIMLSA